MAYEVAKITESRRTQREATAWEQRSYFALEQIADTLEAMRIDAVLFHQPLLTILQTRPK